MKRIGVAVTAFALALCAAHAGLALADGHGPSRRTKEPALE